MRNFSNRKLTVKRVELLERVRKNREDHIKEFKEAHEGWKKEVLAALKRAVKRAEADEAYITHLQNLPEPRSYERDYDLVIDMLEMWTEDKLTITVSEFTCWARNEWDWMGDFKNVAQSYSIS